MSDKTSENYLDSLLGSINGSSSKEEEEILLDSDKSIFETTDGLDDDDEFLRAFEMELEADAYKDFFSNLESEMEMDKSHEVNLETEPTTISEDLGAIIQGLSEDSGEVEAVPAMPDPQVDSAEEMLREIEADKTPEEAKVEPEAGASAGAGAENAQPEGREVPADELSLDDLASLDEFSGIEEIGEPNLAMTEAGEPNLAGINDDDLFSMMASEGGMEEISEMLGQEDGGASAEVEDAFEAFAKQQMEESEAAAEAAEETPEDGKKRKKKSGEKVGFLEKIKLLFFGADDEEESAPVKMAPLEDGATPQELSDENMKILEELDGEEKKGKGKKEKKKKEPKPKKEKPKKEPKPKKEKKPKEPKEVIKTKPLPKGPVFMIWLMAISLVAFVMISTNVIGYSTSVTEAKRLMGAGRYAEAMSALEGVEIKEKDQQLYNQLYILGAVSSQYDSFVVFANCQDETRALDSLVCAAGRYDLNYKNAEKYECVPQLTTLGNQISEALQGRYGMTMEEAVLIYNQKNRTEYTIVLNRKLKELGLK